MSTGNGFYIQGCEKKAMNPFIIYFSNCRIIIIVLHLQYEQHKCTCPLKLDKCSPLIFHLINIHVYSINKF